MKTGAIICEYNPFHNGHKYHIDETRKRYGITHLAAVMSGNFTQRGDVAIIDKWKRTEQALRNGIDLVIELPVTAALGSAENFALGAVTILNSLSCIDYLSFGSECGDIELLKEAAGAVHYALEQESFLGYMRRGLTYPNALQKTIEEFYDDDITKALATPNNTLGIEYLKAINDTGSSLTPVTIKRYGADHDSTEIEHSNFISASMLRNMLVKGDDVSSFMPAINADDFSLLSNLEVAILSALRTMSVSDILTAPNVLQGLENRIYKAVKVARSLPELMMLIKTKRYTMARLRRIILCCYLGITKSDAKVLPQYIRVLGMNDKGKEIISSAKSVLPINTSLMDLSKTSTAAKKQAFIENRADNLYALGFSKPLPCGIDFTHKPVIL